MSTFSENKKSSIKKFCLMFFLVLFLSFSFAPKADATVWPAIDPIIKTGLDKIRDMITNLIVGVLKQAAISMINSQVNSLMSQTNNGQSAFITDWQDYLVVQPKNKTSVYMNDYLSEMTRGRDSYSGYSGAGFSGGRNYAADLRAGALDQLNANDPENNTPQLTYEGDPSQMFDSGNFKNMENYLSGVNNPWAFNIAAENAQQQKLQDEMNKAQTRSVAYQGFNGTSGGGADNITYPGSLAQAAVANAENIPNTVLATAKDIPEVITSIVTRMITNSIQKGFSGVQQNIQKNVNDVQDKSNSITNKAINLLGPQARFN